MNDDTSSTEAADLDEKRDQGKVTDTLNNLLKNARNGRLKCAAIRLYYKDGSSYLRAID